MFEPHLKAVGGQRLQLRCRKHLHEPGSAQELKHFEAIERRPPIGASAGQWLQATLRCLNGRLGRLKACAAPFMTGTWHRRTLAMQVRGVLRVGLKLDEARFNGGCFGGASR